MKNTKIHMNSDGFSPASALGTIQNAALFDYIFILKKRLFNVNPIKKIFISNIKIISHLTLLLG